MSALDRDLTLIEIEQLDEFLAAPDIEDTSMDAATLEGFVAALVLGPNPLPPSQWLPRVWDMGDDGANPAFANAAEAARVTELILRFHNSVAERVLDDPAAFEPLFRRGEQWGVTEWCAGFLLGTSLDMREWGQLIEPEPDWLQPLVILGMGDAEELEATFDDVEDAMAAVTVALVKIDNYWKPRRAAAPARRDGAKVGRNQPCPCGSGRKHKRCCGADERARD